MRTTGTFSDVHAQAGKYHAGETCDVMDPVVRREGDEWMIESQLEPSDGDVEVALDEFCEYWFPTSCPADTPTDSEITNWLGLLDT